MGRFLVLVAACYREQMRLSEFRLAVDDEFGPGFGGVLVRDLVLDELDGLTAERALSAGRSPATVWLALCRAADVPRSRWYGRGRPESKN